MSSTKDEVIYIDVTPTWRSMAPVLVRILLDAEHTPAGAKARAEAIGEIGRMAQAADAWNEHVRSKE